jgi:hypothetical protein
MIRTVPGRPRRRAQAAPTSSSAPGGAGPSTSSTAGAAPASAVAAPGRSAPAAVLSASAETMTACAEELARHRSLLGGPDEAALQGDVVLVVDPDAVPVAEGLAPALEGEAAVQAATGITPRRLRGRLGQFRGLSRYLVGAEGLQSDVQDTRMALRSLGRRHRGRLLARIEARLGELPPGSPAHKRISANAQALRALAARPAELRKETFKKNRAADREIETGLGDIARQKEMVQTFMALQAGEDVPAWQRAVAAETYAEVTASFDAPVPAAPKKTGRRTPR